MKVAVLLGILLLATCLFSNSSKANSSHFYTIQISSPLKEHEAHSLVAKLKSQGVDSFETKIFVKGKKHFRVCSGYFESVKKAQEARHVIAKQTHMKNVFVQKLNGSSLPNRMVLGDFD